MQSPSELKVCLRWHWTFCCSEQTPLLWKIPH